MKKLKVMLVDDEYLVLIGLKAIIEELGHTVVAEAMDGVEAVEKALSIRPDVILLDINIPKMDGIEVAKALLDSVRAPIIMVTGYSDKALIERANAANVLAYVVKPVCRKDLDATLEIAVSRYKDIENLEFEVKKAQKQLEDRKVIEKAKGIIMKQANIDEERAFKWMQTESRNKNMKMVDLALKVLSHIDK